MQKPKCSTSFLCIFTQANAHTHTLALRVKQYQSFWGRSSEHGPEGFEPATCSQDIHPQDAEANPPSQASLLKF